MEDTNIKRSDLVLALTWMILGILVMLGAYKLGTGSFRSPGPGMFPFFLGGILICASLPMFIYVLKDFRRQRKQEISIWRTVNFWKIAVIVIALLVYGIMLERLGFLLTAFLCLFFLFWIAGSKKLSRTLIFTIVTIILTYLLFVIALNVYMPSFPWRELLKIFSELP